MVRPTLPNLSSCMGHLRVLIPTVTASMSATFGESYGRCSVPTYPLVVPTTHKQLGNWSLEQKLWKYLTHIIKRQAKTMGNYAFTYRLHLDCLWDNPTNVVDLILSPTTGQVVVEVADLTKHIKCIHDQVRAQIEKISAHYKEVPDKHPIVVWWRWSCVSLRKEGAISY